MIPLATFLASCRRSPARRSYSSGPPAPETRGALEQALAQLAEGPSSGRRTEQALGELLLAAVDLARARGVDAEQALRERVDDILAARRQTKSERAAPEHRA